MLDGKEIEVKFDGGAGEAYVDVSVDGTVKFGALYAKELLKGCKLKTDSTVEISLVDLLRLAAEKTGNKLLGSAADFVEGALQIGDAKKPAA